MLQYQHLYYVFCVITNFWWSEAMIIFCTNDIKCHVLCHLSSLPYQRCRGLTALNGSIYLYLPTFFKLNVCCHDRYLQKHPANFQRFLTTFQRLPNGAENIRRCSEDSLTGCKESHFYNLPFGQVEANIE